MRIKLQSLLITFLLTFFLLPGRASAAAQIAPGIYFGRTLTIQNGETVNGDLILFDSRLFVEEGGILNGDLLAFDSQIELKGKVSGDVITFGGRLVLDERAQIDGDLITRNTVRRESATEFSETSSPFSLLPLWRQMRSPVFSGLTILLESLLLAVLAFVAALFLERQLEETAQALTTQPLIAGGLGMLTFLVVPLLALVLLITILLIPVALLLILGLLLALLFGWISVGLEIGRRLANFFHREWRFPWLAALGTFMLTLLSGIFNTIPCIGWMVGFLAALLGLGATLITSFGTRLRLPHSNA
ncbi:MAG: polymer-forming cytoskeletal protein [Anaerolineales bacterium]